MSTVVILICLGPSFQKMTHHILLHGSLPPTNPEKNLKPCILAPRSVLYGSGYYCETALIEKGVNIIIFSAPSLCPQSNVQVLTSDNLWKQFRRDKMFSRECLHVQTHISLRCSRKKCYVSFSVPISVLNHLLLVSSAGNLFKQRAPRSGPVKLSCKNGAHVKSHMREECFFVLFLSAHFCPLTSIVIL